uniref:Uncharacterized protein n=1 Tax=Fibrocapsa japonica TaxID=94617 RepID=A0A7S2XXG2_9STRA|mmetsp:Transcript_18604/g.26974  ORF Transcript_18604/g.26974 Transcript_18604/m.26974 type:complete len:208 (+) Transcript_18604:163-786(+)
MKTSRSFFIALMATGAFEKCAALCSERTFDKSSYSQIGFDTDSPSDNIAAFFWTAFFTKPQANCIYDYDYIYDEQCEDFYQGGWDYTMLDDFVIASGMPAIDGLEFALRTTIELGGEDNWCFNTMFLQQTVFFESIPDFNFYYNSEYSNEDGSPICIQDLEDQTFEAWWNVECPAPSFEDDSDTTAYRCTIEQLDGIPEEIDNLYYA